MRARFHAEPIIQATELLLQERAPRDVAVARPRVEEVEAPAHARDFRAPVFRQFTSPHDPIPRTHLLSNGRYSVMLTAAGSGYSRCGGLAITRWREDVTRDHWGTYIFVRDVGSGAVWSAGYQPTGVEPDAYRATFFEDRAEFLRRDGAITTTLEVLVSPEDDAEVRRVSVTNLGAAGARDRADVLRRARPGIAGRRRRAPGVLQALRPDGVAARARCPAGDASGPIAGRAARLGGPRRRGGRRARRRRAVRDGPRAIPRARTGHPHPDVGDRRPAPVEHRGLRARSDREPPAPRSPPARAKVPAWSSRRSSPPRATPPWRSPTSIATRRPSTARSPWRGRRRRCSCTISGSTRAKRTCSRISRAGSSTPTPRSGPSADTLKRNTSGAAALWPHGISGDLPIILVRIDEPEDRGIVRQLLRAHEYWRMKGLAVDLVILNEKAHSYVAGSPDVPGDAGPDEPVGAAAGAGRSPGQGLHPEKGSPLRRGARCPAGGGPGRPPEPTRHTGRAARARAPRPVESGPSCRAARPERSPPPTPRLAAPSSSSSTAWAALSTTGAST